MKLFCVILFSLRCIAVASQLEYSIHGTIIAAVIVNDSLVMVADSRAAIGASNIESTNGVAYIDSLPKIYKIKSFLIAIAGVATLDSFFISKIVKNFNKSYPDYLDFHTTIIKFESYIDSLYPIANYPIDIRFIAAGFVKNKPEKIIFNRTDKKIISSEFSSNGISASNTKVFDYLSKFKLPQFSCAAVGEAIAKSIYEYARDTNEENAIGGPITIVKMTAPNEIIWVKNNTINYKYETITDFINLIENKKITMTPLVNNGWQLGIDSLKSNKYYRQ